MPNVTLYNVFQQPLPTLLYKRPPTVNQHANSIPVWVLHHLMTTLQSNVRYEHQTYGAICSFLSAIFPLERFFSVHPQALIRVPYKDPDSNPLNVSTGSAGGEHKSRHVGKNLNI